MAKEKKIRQDGVETKNGIEYVPIRGTNKFRYRVRVYTGMKMSPTKKKLMPRQECGTFDTIREAKKFRAKQIALHSTGEGVVGKHKMEELFEGLKRNLRNRGKTGWGALVIDAHLQPFFGHIKSEKVVSATLERYVEARRNAGRADSTIKRELTMLKRAFRVAQQTTPPKVGKIPDSARLKEASARQGFFEHAEYQALLEALPAELKPVLVFAYYTGCRRSEILKLRWTQVDLVEQEIRLEPGTTKNEEARDIPLASNLLAVIKQQRELRDRYHPQTPYVFFRHGTGEILKDFRWAWEVACKKCGLWDATAGKINPRTGEPIGKATRLLHDLRRTGVRNLVRSGNSDPVAMSISGHKTRSVFDRYNIVSKRDKKQAVDRLNAYLEQTSNALVTGAAETETSAPGSSRKLLNQNGAERGT